MEFRTTVAPLRHKGAIDHDTPLLMLGSCFTDNIGSRLSDRLFDVLANPFGQLYNAASIAEAVAIAASGRHFSAADLEHDGTKYHSFHHHTRFSSPDSAVMLRTINASIDHWRFFMQRCKTAILTLGTSYVFIDRKTRQIVANCHKFPASRFERRMLSARESAAHLQRTIDSLRQFNPSMNVILTVSPIRHLGDGARQNNLSKGALLEATSIIEREVSGTLYFPSYEIMMDDLRDYRFYAADMVHPSEPAIDYIFKLFAESFFSTSTMQFAKQCLNFAKRLRHRPNSPMTADDRAALAADIESQRIRLIDECQGVCHAIDKLLAINPVEV